MDSKKNLMKVETWLPCFHGFYETEYDLTQAITNQLDFCYPDLPIEIDGKKFPQIGKVVDAIYECIDNDKREEDIARAACDFIKEVIPFVEEIEFEDIYHPREYNFYTDAINVKITIDHDKFMKLIHNEDVKSYLEEYFKENYTSYPGFISHYPNTYEEWEEETEGFTKLDGHYLGAIINGYAEYMLDESIEYEGETLFMYLDERGVINPLNYVSAEKLQEYLDQQEEE